MYNVDNFFFPWKQKENFKPPLENQSFSTCPQLGFPRQKQKFLTTTSEIIFPGPQNWTDGHNQLLRGKNIVSSKYGTINGFFVTALDQNCPDLKKHYTRPLVSWEMVFFSHHVLQRRTRGFTTFSIKSSQSTRHGPEVPNHFFSNSSRVEFSTSNFEPNRTKGDRTELEKLWKNSFPPQKFEHFRLANFDSNIDPPKPEKQTRVFELELSSEPCLAYKVHSYLRQPNMWFRTYVVTYGRVTFCRWPQMIFLTNFRFPLVEE